MFNKLIIACFFLTAFGSCCHKKGCIDETRVDLISFKNFEKSETDTLRFTGYSQGSDFSARTDSFVVYYDSLRVVQGMDGLNYQVQMNIGFDWEVRLSGNNTVYRINDFVLKEKLCNRCITGNSYYTSLESYKVNGKIIPANYLIIEK
ncbi:MAG: hypothetical protein V4635_04280 [Bacteroidota bacterium]